MRHQKRRLRDRRQFSKTEQRNNMFVDDCGGGPHTAHGQSSHTTNTCLTATKSSSGLPGSRSTAEKKSVNMGLHTPIAVAHLP